MTCAGDLDGSRPLPVGVHMVVEDVTYLSRPGTFRVEFDIAAISGQPDALRELLLELKRHALSHIPEREREVGAAIIDYENGRSRIVRFTSNLIQQIKARDMVIAGLGPYSTPNPRDVKRIIPIHTHPNQANPRVTMRWTFPGPLDFAALRLLEADWKRVHGKKIEVYGIVLPTGPNLDQVLYRFEGTGITGGE